MLSEIPNQIAARQSQVEINFCGGMDWYQFPSHYFLPDGVRLRSNQISAVNYQNISWKKLMILIIKINRAERIGTWSIQEGFNDRNLEKMDVSYIDFNIFFNKYYSIYFSSM